MSCGLSSAATGRHLWEHISLLFVEKQLHNEARNKSVHGLWEYKISRFGSAQEHDPHTSCLKLWATVFNSASAFSKTEGPVLPRSVGRLTFLFKAQALRLSSS